MGRYKYCKSDGCFGHRGRYSDYCDDHQDEAYRVEQKEQEAAQREYEQSGEAEFDDALSYITTVEEMKNFIELHIKPRLGF